MDKTTCRWPKCDQPVAVAKHGFCWRDYKRAYGLSDFDTPWIAWHAAHPERPTICRWPGCGRIPQVRGFCRRDYWRAKYQQNWSEPWRAWEPRACVWCGGMFAPKEYRATCCSDGCLGRQWRADNPDRYRLHSRKSTGKRRALKRTTEVEDFDITDVRLNAGDDCYLCGKRINFRLKHPNPLSASLDHVVPLSKGGTHTLDNAAMTHLTCNLKKHVKAADTEPMTTLFAML